MAKTTEKLALHIPEYADEIYETIEQLGQNFAKLDEASPNYATAPPVAGTWQQREIVWNAEPAIGAYLGWVNTRTGRTAPSWMELTSYKTGDYVIPQTDNAHVYLCIQAGHSGAMEPVFPTASGQEVQDTRGAGRCSAQSGTRSMISYFRRSITAVFMSASRRANPEGPNRNGR
ncbi:hypothetical protein WJ0W_003484 [Paenibacillus melissococcoides]|uniref:Uncharacterized protein n=1 Tax=Paenibacillus melissococcoides TaxID=2912268 RepID=A0ABN8U5K0_9BACL|nr:MULTISPECIES: hypothetical protein [Paenibacillus]MEB9896820.1 hypothetical protein [Bacillus cereus]CAH8246249.1 hypothetical protein WJ0W_003484 [Paenibacillus melissococcoides]CAH8713404.1 hypothetical protein WDD9_003557 [Paenibacillus melissococcoides]CAH8714137.1 hypothetical protein HTL2_003860 [Paenibacillus melissococcoides]GIO81410.1 hypothetical protein J6TS7_50200 [Paenibacillus dendritiformis]